MLESTNCRKNDIKEAEQDKDTMEKAKTLIYDMTHNLTMIYSLARKEAEDLAEDTKQYNFLNYVITFIIYYTRQLIYNPKQLDNATAERILKDIFIESMQQVRKEAEAHAEEVKKGHDKATKNEA